MVRRGFLGLILGLLGAAGSAHGVDLLPDMIVDPSAMENNLFDTSARPGRLVLRFESSLANIGPGEFLLIATGDEVSPGFESVDQFITQDSGPDVPVRLTKFTYGNNTNDRHMHGFDWVAFRIREILPENGVGDILRTGQKSFVRLTSSISYDLTLPNAVSSSQRILACGRPIRDCRGQGVSVGWTDIYSPQFDLQWVDVTGLARGEYWLEVEVNFDNLIFEADTTNNAARIKVTLDHPLLPLFMAHRADIREFGRLDLSELLRVIQLFNSGGYQCAENTEDGFQPNGDDTGCQPHTSDYAPQDWSINLSELLRAVQLYNASGFMPCEDGEDGYCLNS